jgi:hypothetical protein
LVLSPPSLSSKRSRRAALHGRGQARAWMRGALPQATAGAGLAARARAAVRLGGRRAAHARGRRSTGGAAPRRWPRRGASGARRRRAAPGPGARERRVERADRALCRQAGARQRCYKRTRSARDAGAGDTRRRARPWLGWRGNRQWVAPGVARIGVRSARGSSHARRGGAHEQVLCAAT